MPDRTAIRRLRSSSGFALTLCVGLRGALAVTVAVARPWVRASAEVAGLPTIEAEVSGATLRPLTGALGVVLLAAFGAVIATRGWLRRSLGILIVAAAAVVVISALLPIDDAGAVEDALAAKGWSEGDYDTDVGRLAVARGDRRDRVRARRRWPSHCSAPAGPRWAAATTPRPSTAGAGRAQLRNGARGARRRSRGASRRRRAVALAGPWSRPDA